MIGEQDKERIKVIRSIYRNLKIPSRHIPYVFMCPKEKNGDVGFIMYIYGGDAFWFYYDEGQMRVDIPSDGYKKHFRAEKRGEEILGKLSKITSATEQIELIKLWPESVWGELCEAFYFWALKVRVPFGKQQNPEFERMRQTHICYANSDNDDIRVFDMEEKMKLQDDPGEPEADILSLRHDANGNPIFSIIEYKCTTAAVKGDVSIPEHYRDMVKYYRDKNTISKLIRLYEWKQEFDERSIEEIDEGAVDRTEIVFLFSNVK